MQFKVINDKYFKGTRLRLRKVVEGDTETFKLTKKENLEKSKKGILKINTIYLTKKEFMISSSLEGIEIEKERSIIIIDKIRIGIDKIRIGENTVYLAEVEFETKQEMEEFIIPINYIREVTGYLKYSGYEIAKRYSNEKGD